jgi:tetratricopeptide (TPR) repeat protein
MARCYPWARGLLLVIGLLAAGGGQAAADGPAPAALAPPRPARPPSPALRAAEAALTAGRWSEAASALHAVVRGPADDAPHRRRAELLLARALHQLGLSSAALSLVSRLLEPGATQPGFLSAVALLLRIQGALPEAAGGLEPLSRVPVATVDAPALRPVRDTLAFALARRLYLNRHFDDYRRARVLLRSIGPSSPLHPWALLHAGHTYLGQGVALGGVKAAECFDQALRAAWRTRPRTAALARLEDAARLSLGDIFSDSAAAAVLRADQTQARAEREVALRMYRHALRFHAAVTGSLADRQRAGLARAWSHYGLATGVGELLPKPARELEQALHAHASATREQIQDPRLIEARIVLGRALFRLGRPEAASTATQALLDEHGGVYRTLEVLVRRHAGDPGRLHGIAVSLRRGDAGLDPALARAVRGVLAIPDVADHLAHVEALDRERLRLRALAIPWRGTRLLAEVGAELEQRRARAITRAGEVAHQALARHLERLLGLLVAGNNLMAEIRRAHPPRRVAAPSD